MFKKIIFSILVLALAATVTAAQDKPVAKYAPGRAELAEEYINKLIEKCNGYHKLMLGGDLASSEKAIADYPDLYTAVLENYIFCYCRVPDSLKTEENHRVWALEKKTVPYTTHSFPEWDELGKAYTEKRLEIERTAAAKN